MPRLGEILDGPGGDRLHEDVAGGGGLGRAGDDPETFQKLFDLARGTYETSRYLFYDNAVNDGKGEKAASGDVEPEGAQ